MEGNFMIKSLENITAKSQVVLTAELQEIFKPVFQFDPSKIQVFVHGSWADDTRTGFSDLDDFIIVDDDYYPIAKPALDAIEITFQKIDPIQHHGHWLIKRSFLDDYDASYMPLHIMDQAVCIFGKSEIHARVNSVITQENNIKRIIQTCKNIETFFSEYESGTLNIYNLKRFVGSISLLPPLIFQIKGNEFGKREAILNANKIYSELSLNVINWASDVRSNWDQLFHCNEYENLFESVKGTKDATKWREYLKDNAPIIESDHLSNSKISQTVVSKFIEDSIAQIDSVKLQKKTIDDYRRGYELIEKTAIEQKAILVGQFGNVKFPGISDLDVFICFEDVDYKNGCKVIEELIRSDSLLNYLFTHTPLYVSRSSLRHMVNLHTIYDLVLTWNPQKITLESALSLRYKNLLSGIWAYIFYKNTLYLSNKEIQYYDIRKLLLLLKNVHTAIRNIEGLYKSESSNCLRKSELLRKKVIEDGIKIRSEIENELKDSISRFKYLVKRISSNQKPEAKSIFIWNNHIIYPSIEGETRIEFGTVKENLPVVFFNLLYNIIYSQNKEGKKYMNSTIGYYNNYLQTGGFINRHVLAIPEVCYQRTLSERKRIKLKYKVQLLLKKMIYSVIKK